MTATATAEVRACGTCGKEKPVGEFYSHDNGHGSVVSGKHCRDCENSRPRRPTVARAVRNRARHRAFQRLAEEQQERFAVLLEEETAKAQHEHDVLQAIGGLPDPTEVVRIKPGPKREGQSVLERIDVARCRRCHTHHDRGHTCPSCGSTEEENDV